MCACVCVCVCARARKQACVRACVRACMYESMSVCVCACVCVYRRVVVYVYVCDKWAMCSCTDNSLLLRDCASTPRDSAQLANETRSEEESENAQAFRWCCSSSDRKEKGAYDYFYFSHCISACFCVLTISLKSFNIEYVLGYKMIYCSYL